MNANTKADIASIVLFVRDGQWYAEFPANSKEARVMGTTTIPTPFFSSYFAGSEVQAKIEQRNPGYQVIVVVK